MWYNDSIPRTQTAFYDDELVVLQGYSAKISDGRREILKVFSPDLQHRRTIDAADKGTIELLVLGKSVIYPAQSVMFYNGSSLLFKETLSDTLFRYKGGMDPAIWDATSSPSKHSAKTRRRDGMRRITTLLMYTMGISMLLSGRRVLRKGRLTPII